MSFDIVITWVDWSHKEFVKEIVKYGGRSEGCEYGEFKEIKYLIRSLEKHNVDYRKIHIVYSDNHPPPKFFTESERLNFVPHSKLVYDINYLPLIYRDSIVTHLHKIPDLHNYYFYLQDDLFIMNSEIFLRNIREYEKNRRLFIARDNVPEKKVTESCGLWFLATRNTCKLINGNYMEKMIIFEHSIQFFDKSVMNKLEVLYPDYFQNTMSYQNQEKETYKEKYIICPTCLFCNYLIYKEGYEEIHNEPKYSMSIYTNSVNDNNYNDKKFSKQLNNIYNFMMFNAQGNGISDEYPKCDKVYNKFYGFLDNLYPIRSIHEKVYVYFTTINGVAPLNFLSLITPGSCGKWKNIIGTEEIENADNIIVMDDIGLDLLNDGKENFLKKINNQYDKLIFFDRENISVTKKRKPTWFISDILPKIIHNYSTENGFAFTFMTPHFIGKTYDELKEMKYPDKSKILSAIVSSKEDDIYYLERKKFLIEYSKNNTVDIYGSGWDKKILGNNYKGELGNYFGIKGQTTKFDGLINYQFSLCLENYPQDRIVSEKFTDVILAWCIPIYSGNADSNPYPKDSYLDINVKNFSDFNKINEFIKQGMTNERLEVLGKTRDLILDKYNIWEQIYQIIFHPEQYKKNYYKQINKNPISNGKYICECGFSCKKIYYFQNHRNQCKIK